MPAKAGTDLHQYSPTGDGVHSGQLKPRLGAPIPTKIAVLPNSQNCNCNNILNPLKLWFLLDWMSEQVTLISVAAFFPLFFALLQQASPSNLRYLFMTGLSFGSYTSGQSRSGLERVREEHTHIISKGLEAANFCFLRWERKKVNFWILSQVGGWRYLSVLVHSDTILFFPLVEES